MSKPYNIDPLPELVQRLSFRIGQMDQNGYPWQRKDADLLREARDQLFAIVVHIKINGESLTAIDTEGQP